MVEYAEARRLATVALLICDDLEAHESGRMSQVERVMLRRHYVALHIWEGVINVFLELKFDFSRVPAVSTELLEGESSEIGQYLNMWNLMTQLIGSPYITILMLQIGRAVHGQSYELTLDMILQFEQKVLEWWDNLPDDFRICDDPFTPAVEQVVDSITSSVVLVPFAILHALSALVQSSLLRPPSVSLQNSATDDMIRIIQEKATSITLSSTKALVYVMKRNLEVDVEAVPLSIGYMLGTLHAVCSIVNNCTTDGVQLPVEVFDLLFRCFTQINALFPPGHQVPASSSTLEAFMADFKNFKNVDRNIPFPTIKRRG
ncbi:hypothetical protein BDB00DRAFT_509263 [Zychaea mexicana]|uniref:uncharacterized protein n=1 Tax=Zychaea mexicana TaxID=64656 RepID=UPI0022FED371|nr:uncharacterized protein BDB00DRAFT_509263 [Zychaea mexicana]KAI9491302.1 hypothetical protein BDB00DRAFT_509263 [Zychaea mexicana]